MFATERKVEGCRISSETAAADETGPRPGSGHDSSNRDMTGSGCDPADHLEKRNSRDSLPPTVDRVSAIAAVRQLLIAVGDDPNRPELARTPQRVAEMFTDLFSGIGVDPASALGTPLEDVSPDEVGDLIALTGIRFRSVCEHHLLPFMGTADVFYAPDRRIAGLSRIAGVVEAAARRPQLQERLGMDIARAIMTVLQPHGVTVRIEAAHGCVAHMAPDAAGARALSIARLGSLPDSAIQLALREHRSAQ